MKNKTGQLVLVSSATQNWNIICISIWNVNLKHEGKKQNEMMQRERLQTSGMLSGFPRQPTDSSA